MKNVFKTWKKATYLEGMFELQSDENYAFPIDFPTVFTAYGAGIKSGNWQSCTAINTPEYVINNYFDTIGFGKHDEMSAMWTYCKQLEDVKWSDVAEDKNNVLELIKLANIELLKLQLL